MNSTMPSRESLGSLVENFRHGSRRALSRLITCLQDGYDSALIVPAMGPGDGRALKVGLTGSAGAGKSTLAAALIQQLRQANQSVAVLACDPASPLTGGALLGDRVRMQAAAVDASVFWRSLSTRGAAGGVSDSTAGITALMEQFGFDVILVETIGVGQDQLAVRGIVDVLVMVVTPASGDQIQWQKAGLLEVADIIIVNKADLPGADEAVGSLRDTLRVASPGRGNVVVLPAVATTGSGILEVWQAIEASYEQMGRRQTELPPKHELLR